MPGAVPDEFFTMMRSEPVTDRRPGYLAYWDARAENNPDDERVRNIVSRAALEAVRDGRGDQERGQSAQGRSRYFYRSLGPDNSLVDAEPDLVRAAERMLSHQDSDPQVTGRFALDAAHALVDVVRITPNPTTRRVAAVSAQMILADLRSQSGFREQPPVFQMSVDGLEVDIRHDLNRAVETGTLEPKVLETEPYRRLEQKFVATELDHTRYFQEAVNSFVDTERGRAPETFGAVFRSFAIIDQRRRAADSEECDIEAVRMATTRQSAQWRGEIQPQPTTRLPDNYDFYTRRFEGPSEFSSFGSMTETRWQVNTRTTAAPASRYVKVLDFQQLVGRHTPTPDAAVHAMQGRVAQITRDYAAIYSIAPPPAQQ